MGSCETSAHVPPLGQMAESWLLVPSRARFFLYRLGEEPRPELSRGGDIRVDDRAHLAFLTVLHRQRSGRRTCGSAAASFNPTVQLKEGTL